MSAYLVVDIKVHDETQYQEYIQRVPEFVAKHGGTYLVRGAQLEVKEGDWHPERLVVLQFPDKEAAQAFLDDPGYQPVAAIRHSAATTNLVLADVP